MLGQKSADAVTKLFRDACSIATSESLEGAMKAVPVLNLLELGGDLARTSAARVGLRRGLVSAHHHNENQQKQKAGAGAGSAATSPRQYRIPTETTTSCVFTFLLGA